MRYIIDWKQFHEFLRDSELIQTLESLRTKPESLNDGSLKLVTEIINQIRNKCKNIYCTNGFQIFDIFCDNVLSEFPDFTTAPASTKYHGACEGGLLTHSLAVYEAALKTANAYGIEPLSVNPIACVFHDLCKCGAYVQKSKTDKAGQIKTWYDYAEPENASQFTIGHGAESLRRIFKILNTMGMDFDGNISYEWQLAVNYHMGVFGVTNEEMMRFSKVTEKVPEVLLLHHADMIATKIYHV